MLSGLNSPDREDYVLADRGNYAQKELKQQLKLTPRG